MTADGAPRAALLHDVGEFVGQQGSPAQSAGQITSAEHDIVPGREGGRVQSCRRVGSGPVGMYPDPAEVLAEQCPHFRTFRS